MVGRASDYVLRDSKNLVRIFIYAPMDYRIKKVMEMYHDTKSEAKKNIQESDKNRSNYYELISGQKWGDPIHYDLCIDSSIGKEKTAEIICDYITKIRR